MEVAANPFVFNYLIRINAIFDALFTQSLAKSLINSLGFDNAEK